MKEMIKKSFVFIPVDGGKKEVGACAGFGFGCYSGLDLDLKIWII